MGLAYPWTISGARDTVAPYTWAITWWPRQTPRRGTARRSASWTRSRQTSESAGCPGPGLSSRPSTDAASRTVTSERSLTTQSAPSSRRYWTMLNTKLSWLSTTRTRISSPGTGRAGRRTVDHPVIELDLRLQPRKHDMPEHDTGHEDKDEREDGLNLPGSRQSAPDPGVHGSLYFPVGATARGSSAASTPKMIIRSAAEYFG